MDEKFRLMSKTDGFGTNGSVHDFPLGLPEIIAQSPSLNSISPGFGKAMEKRIFKSLNENSGIPMEKDIDNENGFETVTKSLLSIAVEAWRFSRVYERLISKLDAGEQKRFFSQFRYFQKQLEDNLLDAGYRLKNLEGQAFDPGIAATAINQNDFLPEDALVVDQMLEPVILNENGIVKMGKVFLRKVEKT